MVRLLRPSRIQATNRVLGRPSESLAPDPGVGGEWVEERLILPPNPYLYRRYRQGYTRYRRQAQAPTLEPAWPAGLARPLPVSIDEDVDAHGKVPSGTVCFLD